MAEREVNPMNAGTVSVVILDVLGLGFIALLLAIKWPDIKQAWEQAEPEDQE